jgi:hypothetical protein
MNTLVQGSDTSSSSLQESDLGVSFDDQTCSINDMLASFEDEDVKYTQKSNTN